jgi:phosphate-selective porin OprO/OprP
MFSDKRFEYSFGVFNGNGPNTAANDNNDYLYALRLGVYPNGYVDYSQASMEDPDEVMFGIGAGVAFNTVPMTEEDTTYDTDITSATVDLVLKYRGLAVESAFHHRDTDENIPGMAKVTSRGFVVQAGYMFVPEKFEFALRYAFVDPNKDIEDFRNSEYTAGWNYFFRMHDVKMQMDYSYLVTEEPGQNDLKDNRVRLQFQYKF